MSGSVELNLGMYNFRWTTGRVGQFRHFGLKIGCHGKVPSAIKKQKSDPRSALTVYRTWTLCKDWSSKS